VGVLKAGWHCGGNPAANGTVADCPDCKICQNNTCVPDPGQNGRRSASGNSCCVNGGQTPLEPASFTALRDASQCPSPTQNSANNDIDGCSAGIPNFPSTNVQDPTNFLYGPLLFNQASTAFGANVGSVPLGTPQSLPCNRHDICYQQCGSTQAACDNAFHNDMDSICSTAYPATCPYSGLASVACPAFFVERAECFSASTLYYNGVNQLGGSAYETDQVEHCQCCR